MTYKLKLLGVGVLAAAALTAALASGAIADELRSELNQGVTLTGSQVTANELITTWGTIECTETKYSGSVAATPTGNFKLTPTFGGECSCGGLACTPTANGCEFQFTIGAATTGQIDLLCPTGKEITFTLGQCTFHFKPKNNIGGFTLLNAGAGQTREIEVKLEAKAVEYTLTQGTGTGKCTTGGAMNGSLLGTIKLTAENGGGHVGIFAQ